MSKNYNSGQITVFLSIILLAVVILVGLLVDVSRVRSGEALVKKSVESAARSVLAGYSSKIKENYGIFAYASEDEASINNTFIEYLKKNLTINGARLGTGENAMLYGFKIEKVNVTPLFNLSENAVFKQQVLEYMKYRAPKEMVEEFLEKLSAIKDMGKMSVAYEKKVQIDKTLGKMDKAQQGLKKSIDGTGETGGNYVNGFNLNGCWKTVFENYYSLNSEMASLKKTLETINSEIANLQSEMGQEESSAEDSEEDKKDKENNSKLTALIDSRSSILSSISSLSSNISSIGEKIRGLTNNFIDVNETALQQMNKIVELGRNAEAAIGDLEKYVNDNLNSEASYSVDFADALKTDIENIKEIILNGQKAVVMTEQLENNKTVLAEIVGKLDLLKGMMMTGNGGTVGIGNNILEMLDKYDNIEYSYEKPDKGKSMEDPRNSQAEKLKDALLVKLFNDKNYQNLGIAADELPSRLKKVSKTFDDEDAPYIYSNDIDGSGNTNPYTGVEYTGELGSIAKEADLQDEEGEFQKNALEFAGSIGNILSGGIGKLRDNLYINEYIMGMFKNQVPAIKLDEEEKASVFLNGMAWDEKETFYDCEVEYILHGNASEITNRTLTEAQILLLRFGADTLHVYTDPKKKEIAIATATAISGWWTGGAGIPIISNLIMCAWGMGEAIIDIRDLKEGKQVPVYKSKGDWKLDIGIPKVDGTKTDTRLNFTYHDYLRLLLLAMDENKKLDRLEDLIEIDLGLSKPGFKASGCNTFLRAEVQVSMNSLFLSKPFIPANMRTKDGRQIIKVLVYEGY